MMCLLIEIWSAIQRKRPCSGTQTERRGGVGRGVQLKVISLGKWPNHSASGHLGFLFPKKDVPEWLLTGRFGHYPSGETGDRPSNRWPFTRRSRRL